MITERDYKKENLLKCILRIILSVFLYFFMRLLLKKIQIENIYILEICRGLTDAGAVFAMTLFCNLIVVAVSNGNDFTFRIRTHIIELISIIELVGYILLKENQTRLWVDIVLFCIFFFYMLIKDSDYLNKRKVIEVRQTVFEAYRKYSGEYDIFIENVDRFNEMEDELLQARVENANDDKEIQKAEKDKREIYVSGKWNPDRYDFPDDGGEEYYTGIWGLLGGKDSVWNYIMVANRYIDKLRKDYQKYEKKNREIIALKENAENAKRYVSGTKDEQQIEKMLEAYGGSIDRSEKVKKSYKKFNRRWFDKKIIKY